jgi:superoxide dismutase, Fe-Mn family
MGNKCYEAKDFSSLYSTKFNKELLSMHLKLYQGYVDNVNKVEKLLSETHAYTKDAIKRRFSWEYNGMKLHELYFDGIISSDLSHKESSFIFKVISKQYGSYEKWEEGFIDVGKIRGIGWCVVYLEGDKIINGWIDNHNIGCLICTQPLIVMDVWEHAYITAYGTDREKYIKDFIDSINWDVVDKRYFINKQSSDTN